MPKQVSHSQLVALVKFLNNHVSRQLFDDICFAMEVDPDNIPGDTLKGKIRELVLYANRHLQMDDFFEAFLAVWEGGEVDLTPYGYEPKGKEQPPSPSPAVPDSPSDGPAFVNFDLRVGARREDGRYPVEVTHSPAGEMRNPVLQTFPLDDPEFTDLIAFLNSLIASGQDAKVLGRKMRDLLFPGEVWQMFYASYTKSQAENKRLRVRLRIDPPELSRLPWEYVYDDTFQFLGLNRDTPIMRYVAEPFAPDNTKAPRPLRILLAMAAPQDQAPLNLSEEEARIRKALEPLGDQVMLHVIPHTTAGRLHAALADGYHVLHFLGHGAFENGMGALVLEDDEGNSRQMDADQLMILLRNTAVKVVVLNACQTAAHGTEDALSGVAPALVRAEIPAVVAMQFPVPDKTALGFARDLYRFLAKGQPLDLAVTEMRIGAFINGADRYFWGIPVLYMRSPDGRIW
ncbi:MAG: CHAT domain-containing protein [Chloroflexi bacterium]|nr:MAG: CHAT domain-containing protein [Chloroflexota bacterium]